MPQSAAAPQQAHELFGDAKPPANTRQRIIYRAIDLFFEHGFHAVGIDRIIADVGVTKTTFYNHFSSKDGLIIETICVRDQWETEVFYRKLLERSHGDPHKMILAYFDVVDESFNSEAFQGCQFLNACAEFPSPNDPVHQAAAEHYVNSEKMMRETARRLGVNDPGKLAAQLTMLIEGAMTRRLVTGDNSAARSAREIAKRLIDDAVK